MDPVTPLRVTPTAAQAKPPAAPAPAPPPAEPRDSVQTAPKAKGIDFGRASKILDYESESLGSAVTLWQLDAKHYDSTAFVSSGGHFYEGGLDGTLRRFAPDGAIVWEKKTGHNELSVTPAIAPDGTAYVSRVVSLEAYNPDGSLKWDLPLPGPQNMERNSLQLKCSAGADGSVYIHDGTKLYAVAPEGKIAWKKDIQPAWSSNPPVVGPAGQVFCVDRQNTVFAFDAKGIQLWKSTEMTGEKPILPDITTPLVAGPDGSVYYGTRNSSWDAHDCRLVALDPQGRVKWSVPTDSELSNYEVPSVDGKTGTVYTGSGRDGKAVVAVSPDGKVKWRNDVGPILHVTAMPEGKGVIVGIKGGDLHAFDGEGKALWTFHTGKIFTKPSFGPDGVVYVGSGETLYALEARDRYLEKKMDERRREVLEGPEAPKPPAVEEGRGWIIIDGVKLPIRK